VSGPPTLHISPAATEEDAAAIVAAVEALWPRPVLAASAPSRPVNAWRYSGRWWSRPVAARRDRPWY
jgi:hypothetical protein